MARFKAPNFNLFYLARGFLYILQSLGYLPFTFLLFSFIWFLKSIKKFNLNNQYLPFFVSLFVFGQILFAVLSGGDYFGPNLARYTFTSCVTFAFFLLLLYFSAENKLIVHQNIFIYFTTFWIAVSLLSGFSFSKVFTQPVNYGFGRTSCELLAAESIKEFLQEHKVGKIQVITSEVNGIPYHLNAKLVDNIGLVDSSLYPMKLEPSSRGNILNRYRVPISLQQIRSSNILWAWGSAACDDWDIYRFLDVNRHMSNFEMLNQIYNHFPANYRFNNLKTYIENGYKVYKIEFRYKLGNSISLRKGQVLALIRI